MKHPHFLFFLCVFAASSTLLVPFQPLARSLLIGFDAAALLFFLLTIAAARKATPERMRMVAARDDAGRGFLLLVSALLVAVVLVAIGLEVAHRRAMQPSELGLVVATLALAWGFANLVCARHYAHLFYESDGAGGDCGGLVFPGTDIPDLKDFIYFALVIGMTFQVSDVQITSRRLRHASTLHAVSAFFFNLGILALTVNVVASAL